ncbi:MAG TPA: tRNA (adenosine(37)-N6)-threonylcarbamoyltransferase complex dimerization subunit type 1 TsaB [Anaerolineales bacterium]|nr:tRNA (adenosine(37)-N6)-threonylcarbamoyltransferase complex dimerization subunit type 1 TsaB [Anaerolineales bacterium]
MTRATIPLLLALDTSTRAVGLALYNGAQILNETTWLSHDHHTVELAPAIEEALSKSNTSAKDLSSVVVALGPGSFTGLRIGLALAKGLAIVRHIPIIGIPTLEILASGQMAADLPLAALIRAGRGRFAVGWYEYKENQWVSSGEVEVHTPETISEKIQSPTFICGELNREEREYLTRQQPLARLASPSACVRRPAILAELGWKRWQQGKVDDPANLAPIYLHYNDPIPG